MSFDLPPVVALVSHFMAQATFFLFLDSPALGGLDGCAMSESDDDSKTVTAYSYEGTEIDGSTKIEAESASYREFVNGLVRTKYSQSDVEAILCNHGDGNKEHETEYQVFQEWREQAKQMARELLDRDIS